MLFRSKLFPAVILLKREKLLTLSTCQNLPALILQPVTSFTGYGMRQMVRGERSISPAAIKKLYSAEMLQVIVFLFFMVHCQMIFVIKVLI